MKDLIEALTILSKYTDSERPCGCEHDVFRVYVDPDTVDENDKRRLETLGFDPDEECGCFMSFRFGSA